MKIISPSNWRRLWRDFDVTLMLNVAILSYNQNKITQFSAQITRFLTRLVVVLEPAFIAMVHCRYCSFHFLLRRWKMKCQQVNEIVQCSRLFCGIRSCVSSFQFQFEVKMLNVQTFNTIQHPKCIWNVS